VNEPGAATFTGLVDLAAESLDGRALGASDEFFAAAANLLKPGRGVFLPDEFTDRGKWMDGWESRRKRTPGYDYCVIALGVQGIAIGFDIDTHHFNGNHPQFASVDGAVAPAGASFDELQKGAWVELLSQVPLRPDAQNLFVARPSEPVTHLRLNIFPDGGVARFRAFGRVTPRFEAPELDAETAPRVQPGWVDLAAVANGGVALACSDARFGPMNNLLLPGRARDMGGGWETRRSRQGGHDWILVELAARGVVRLVEIDTNHFKGNYPDRCSLESCDARPGTRTTELISSVRFSPVIAETPLEAHTRHFFPVAEGGAEATHVRLNIFPDGGISRLRIWGTRTP
jgi:allantoicase